MNKFWQQIQPSHLAGIGFKPRYFNDLLSTEHEIGWVEIHAENYMVDGGPHKQQLLDVAEKYPVTCHGVGLSIGSMEPLNEMHLARLKGVNEWLKPAIFSEHLAWSTHTTHYMNDLLPMPYTKEVLRVVVEHIDQVQETLGRTMLLENPSTYLSFGAHEMPETEFLHEIVRQAGCGMLLDVNNVYVTAINQNLDPYAYIDALPLESIGEMHLSGHSVDGDEAGARLLIDSHDAPVAKEVWALFDYTVAKLPPTPTLIEWDSNFPSWEVLRDQAHTANAVIARSHHKTPHKIPHVVAR